MTHDEAELPLGWAWASLEDVANVLDHLRQPVSAGERAKRAAIYPYFGANGQAGMIDDYLIDGDHVLVAEDGGYFDDASRGVAYRVRGKAWVNNHAHILRARTGVSTEFLLYALNAVDWMRYVSGTTRLKLTQARLRDVRLPLAPQAEQRRIVAKLDALLASSRAARAALDAVPGLLEQYRKATLTASFRVEARTEGHADLDCNDGQAVVAQIDANRMARGLNRTTVSDDVPTASWPLPPDWVWSRIGDLFDVYVGGTPSRSKPEYWGGDVPWVSSSEVAFSRVDCTREQISSLGLRESAAKLHPAGTLLLGMIGEGKTRGQVAILDVAAAHSQNSAAIRVSETAIIPEFVYYYLQQRYELTRRAGSGNGQQALNKARVQSFELPVAPVAKQRTIVARLEAMTEAVRRVSEIVESQLESLIRYEGSVLARAFRGELVPQDPADEPASVMLSRLTASAASPTRRTRRASVRA